MGRKKLVEDEKTVSVTIRIPASLKKKLENPGNKDISSNIREAIEYWLNNVRQKKYRNTKSDKLEKWL